MTLMPEDYMLVLKVGMRLSASYGGKGQDARGVSIRGGVVHDEARG
jgi:hypothetical protein